MSESERDLRHAQEMRLIQAERRAERASRKLRGGLLIVLTGSGKGKSSSAFGMVARALGWDMRVGFEVMGEGFTWDVQDRQRDIAAACQAWQRSCAMIRDAQYDFVLLDELNIALRNEYLDVAAVVAFLEQRPRDKHICITGRDAPPRLLEIADLVTEVSSPKHPYQAGYKAQRGVEF
jgi:cob(I)alamin adenosyltransferase